MSIHNLLRNISKLNNSQTEIIVAILKAKKEKNLSHYSPLSEEVISHLSGIQNERELFNATGSIINKVVHFGNGRWNVNF